MDFSIENEVEDKDLSFGNEDVNLYLGELMCGSVDAEVVVDVIAAVDSCGISCGSNGIKKMMMVTTMMMVLLLLLVVVVQFVVDIAVADDDVHIVKVNSHVNHVNLTMHSNIRSFSWSYRTFIFTLISFAFVNFVLTIIPMKSRTRAITTIPSN
jgi:hypothetical protein